MRRSFFGFGAAAAVSAFAAALSQAAPPPTPPAALAVPTPTGADFRMVDPDNLLVIDTNKGRILAELTPFAGPLMVERVKILARQHFYDGLTFFRVIDDFMAQTGDPKNTGEGASSLPDLKGEFMFRRDSGSPFVRAAKTDDSLIGFLGVLPVATQPDELMLLTADSRVSAWPLFCPGVLGVARGNDPDSGNSQFFLMRAPYPSLAKKYGAFGRVVIGQDVVRAIKTGEPVSDPQDRMIRVRLASDLPPAERPKVAVLDTRSPVFAKMIQAERAKLGADFSVCALQIPAEIR